MRRANGMMKLSWAAGFLLLMASAACDSRGGAGEERDTATPSGEQRPVQAPEAQPQEQPQTGQPTEQPTGQPTGEPAEPLPTVEVSAEGTRFDPPVLPEQLPDGVWFCDMGTVHFAIAGTGEQRCPICGMRLTTRGDAPEPAPGDTAPTGHEGHDHP
jgi:hypothetical protein